MVAHASLYTCECQPHAVVMVRWRGRQGCTAEKCELVQSGPPSFRPFSLQRGAQQPQPAQRTHPLSMYQRRRQRLRKLPDDCRNSHPHLSGSSSVKAVGCNADSSRSANFSADRTTAVSATGTAACRAHRALRGTQGCQQPADRVKRTRGLKRTLTQAAGLGEVQQRLHIQEIAIEDIAAVRRREGLQQRTHSLSRSGRPIALCPHGQKSQLTVVPLGAAGYHLFARNATPSAHTLQQETAVNLHPQAWRRV